MNAPLRHEKHFSLARARALLRDFLPLLGDMVHLAQHLKLIGYDIYRHKYFGGLGPNGDREYPKELDTLIEILKDFDAAGILVKGPEIGLIDFPHIRSNGEEVYLCYQWGEETIRYWHSIGSGFAGRKPLTAL